MDQRNAMVPSGNVTLRYIGLAKIDGSVYIQTASAIDMTIHTDASMIISTVQRLKTRHLYISVNTYE